jgi:Dehydrogenases with different specificities (related to short-chain alcohol dehydrogenases)
MIVGASSGIGEGIAKKLSSADTMVVLVARRKDRLVDLQRDLKGNSIVIPCDLMKSEDIESVFDILAEKDIRLDGLIYCAGVAFVKTLKSMDKNDLENMFRINVFGFYEMCRCFQKVKVSHKGAAIVGISSYAAVSKETGMSAYAMTKEAMNVQVQVLAKELLKRKIRINTVMPANVMSKMGSDSNEWSEAELEAIEKKQPLGIIPIESVVELVLFLLSDHARYITGESVAISAGYHN